METITSYYIDLIARYFFGEASPEEIKELETWVKADPANAAIFSEYGKTWKLVNNTGIESSIDVELEWKTLASKLQIDTVELQQTNPGLQRAKSEIEHHRSKILYWSVRIAAIFILLAVPAFFLYRYSTTPVEKQLTASGAMAEQTLPDGTIVTLNTGATLSYPSRFEGSFRRVTLKGEAWFEVTHDKTKPFIISSENARIRVVGTSFSVNTQAREGTKEIILSSGLVSVYFENSPEKTTMLFPGEKAELIPDGCAIIKSVNEDVNFLSWKTKRIIFNDTPLSEAAALLTKVYHTNIRLSGEGLNNCRITATFDRQSLESVLNVLKATLDLQAGNTGAGIELSGRGCNRHQ
jgi:ferric-dicitrate binding protein FerR (iron transport regulator)